MDFSKYKGFRKKINDEYGYYYKKYPNAILVLDYLIQISVHSEFQPTSGINKKDFVNTFDELTESNFIRNIYNFYLHWISYVFKPYKNTFTVHSSIENHKFPGLNQIFFQVSKKNNWKSIFHANIEINYLIDVLLLRKISPYSAFISRNTKKVLSKCRISDKTSLLNFLKDKSLMSDLDRRVQSDIGRTTKLISRLSINIYINTGDSSGFARVLNEAIKNTNFKTISFSHGYIGDPNLLGVAPIWSDKLVLWTRKQRQEIELVLDKNLKSKLEFIGYPKNISTDFKKIKNKKALILVGPIYEILINEKLNALFSRVIKSIQGFSKEVILRLHPHERAAKIPEIENFIKQNNIKLSKNDLNEDLSNSQYIFGTDTSTLVEAAYAGKKVYHIEDLVIPGRPLFDYEGAIKIKSKKINSLHDDDFFRHDEAKLSFNEKEFSKNFEKLILSLHL